MKINNQIMVAVAFGMAITASLAGKLDAKSEQGSVNNNVYGFTRNGQCLLGDPNDIIEPGCVVSMNGYVCHVYMIVNGVAESPQAFKSPISGAMCSLTLRTPQ